PVLGPMTPSIGEIFRYVLEAPDSVPQTKLREIQDYVVIPKILQAQGVVDVANFGGLVKQYQIIVDPLKLEKYELTIGDLAQAVSENNRNTGGNFIHVGASQINIRGVGRITGVEEIENIVVDNRDGVPLLIKDLATVETGILPPTGILGYVDKTRGVAVERGIEGIVLLRKFENPSRTIRNVYEKVAELNEKILPPGIKIVPFYDRTELVELTLRTVAKTLLEGTAVVMVVLTLLLGGWRPALISALAIPFALLFAFLVMHQVGLAANLLSLGAIDFGIIVDATIVMVEAMVRGVHQAGGADVRNSIRAAVVGVRKQIFFSIVIIILALLPVLTLERVEGRLFGPMAWTLVFAIGGSLIYALTLAPVLATYLFGPRTREAHHFFWRASETAYASVVRAGLRVWPLSIAVLTGGIAAMAYVFWPKGTEFLPELDEGCVWVRLFLPSGISLVEAEKYPQILRREIAKFDEVRGVLTQLGRNDDGTDPFGPNRIEMLIQLVQPYSKWPVKRTKTEWVLMLKRRIQELLPGVAFTISQPIIDTTTENATGSSSDIAVFINGKDPDVLRRLAEEILEVARGIRGASETAIEQEQPQTQLTVRVRRESAARYGVNVSEVCNVLETAVGGFAVSELYENERKFEIVLRYPPEYRGTPESIGKIIVAGKNGMRVPLARVADVKFELGQTIIFHENGNRQMTVKSNVRGRDQGGFAQELDQSIAQKVVFPDGYEYYLGGQFENLKRSRERLFIVVPVTLFLIFAALMVFFDNNFKYSFVVFLNIPIAAVGGLFGLWIRDMNFSISAGVGMVSLLGLSVMGGVLLLGYFNQIKMRYDRLEDMVVEGAVVQFRPRFMVMSIAIIGLLPAALNTGVGSDVQRPLATVIVGGLCFVLVFGLPANPIFYYFVERTGGKNRDDDLAN
ncbi:MAG: CusA/CzcA family heavy metal efflux RND transporter, partial [Bacteroidia bacterium]|nr:CusA/CzcA family heavy metal efflux RND transporter [Bacteroidia bacterium]